MNSGDGSHHCCRASPATPGGRGRTIGCSWKRCCGLHARVRLGATCTHGSETGTRCSGVSAGERRRVFSRVCSNTYLTIPTSSTPSSMARLSGSTSTVLAQGGTQNQAIGRSRGDLTTKILVLTDALDNLARFMLLPGQRHDSAGVLPLTSGLAFDTLLGDKAFDADWIRADLVARGQRLWSRRKRTGSSASPTTRQCISVVILLRIIFVISSSSGASPRGMTRPTQATPR